MDSGSPGRESSTPGSTQSTGDFISTSEALGPASLHSTQTLFTEPPRITSIVQPALYDGRDASLSSTWSAPNLVVFDNEERFSSQGTTPLHAQSFLGDPAHNPSYNPLAFDSLEAHPFPVIWNAPQDDQFLSMWSSAGMGTRYEREALRRPCFHNACPVRWTGRRSTCTV
jgi:hypothetical protein